MQHDSARKRCARGLGALSGAALIASTLALGAPQAAAAIPDPTIVNQGAPGVADAFNGVAAAPDGGTFSVGYQVVDGTNKAVLVTKSNPDGSLDTSFGTEGRAVVDLVSSFHSTITTNPGTKEQAKGVAVDRLGRILVLGEVDGDQSEASTASDTDIFVARLHPRGTLDTSYGDGGWTRISLSDGTNPRGGAPVPDYAGYDIAIRGNGKAVFTAGVGTDSKGTRGTRSLATVQVKANGGLDTSFGSDGVVAFPTSFSVNVRRGFLDTDGSWFSTGYANVGSNNQPFISKVTADGKADASWGDDGLTTLYPGGNGGFAEAYGFSRLADGNYLVSAYGYRGGRTGAAANNNVDAILFSLKSDGSLNRSWGENGLVAYHFGEDGNGSGDRHRGHVVLPDGRIVGVGATQGTNDAIVTVTAPDGSSGESASIDLGGTDDVLWGLTTIGNGYQVVAAGVGDGDAKLVTIDLTASAPAVAIQLAKSSASFGVANTATVQLRGGGQPVAGSVDVAIDGTKLDTVQVDASGTATVALPRTLSVGSHELTATRTGSSTPSASAALTVVKAGSKSTVSLSKKKIKRSQRATASIKVSGTGVPSGSYATGTVTIYDGAKKIGTVKLTASGKGAAKFKLPKLSAKKHSIKVSYSGNGNLKGSSAKATLTVIK
ncbi:MAG: Ig-like domain repeat protein [Micropruina sp.]|uniref:Ig-like domain repeat protein n=1 Tax=Micropruina sp. TaxID=2737536 RepID=UPI0039E6CAC1